MALKYLYAPSGAKAGKAYGVLPNSANADFDDFTRNSAGSRVDKNGLINTGLGLGSEEVVNGDFDSASNWEVSVATISGGRAIFISATNAYSYVRQAGVLTQNKEYEVTINLTVNSGSGIKFQDGSGTTFSVISESGVHTRRFTATTTNATFVIAREFDSGGYDMYVESVSVREITEVNTDVPRLDYTGGGCPSLLLEPASTNKIGYSEDFTQSSWTKEGNPTIESNVEISPTGSLNGSYLKAPVGTNISPRIVYYFGCASGQTYTGSIFVKKDNVDYIRLLSTGATASTLQAYYNVSNGTLGSAGSPDKAKIEDYGNGWYRLSLVINTTQNTGGATFRVQLAKGDNNPASTFDGTEKNIIFGAQLEQQSYATSYIPNYGTSAGVTRSADNAGSTGDLSNVINSSEGVLYAEISAFDNTDTSNRFISILNGTNADNGFFIFYGGATNRIRFQYNTATENFNFLTTSFNSEENNKIAFLYKSNKISIWINGVEVKKDTTLSSTPTNLDNLAFNRSGSEPFYGKTKEIRIYDTTLTDIELEELTSWSSFVEMANELNYIIE